MSSQPVSAHGLKMEVEEKPYETIVHCSGKISSESAEAFQSLVRGLIPASRGHLDAITCRIVLDMSHVNYVDSAGLGAIFGVWTSSQKNGCNLEMANLNPRVQELFSVSRLDSVFKKVKDLFRPDDKQVPS